MEPELMKNVHFFIYLVNPGYERALCWIWLYKIMCEHVSNVEYGAEEKGVDEERQYQPADMHILHLEQLVPPIRYNII
jgi:hypothetical protein